MMVSQGGTQIYCPACKEIQVCRAVNPSEIAYESGQRWENLRHPDIQWFRRGRVCLACRHEFLTAEIEEDLLTELVKLREALADIHMKADEYVRESNRASKALQELSRSLRLFKVLGVDGNSGAKR